MEQMRFIISSGYFHNGSCKTMYGESAASVSLGTLLDPPCLQGHYHSNSPHEMARLLHEQIKLLTKYLEEPCPKWVIKESILGGRGLFAAQPILKGSLIFSNKPLVVAPRADRAGVTYCSVCFKINDSCRSCNKCCLIVCSEDCNARQEHAVECDFISKNWISKSCGNHSEILAHVQIYVRFLLLSDDVKTLLPVFQSCQVTSNADGLKLLCSKYHIPKDQVQFIKVMHSILKINSFRIASNLQDNKVPLRGLFPISAFLNHSCVPNTRNIFSTDCTMAIYATKDIEAGEEILTCYTGLLWCTPARRCQLYKTKSFRCQCERCKDSTEMGTNLAALKCFNKECVGVLLPVSPLDPRGEWFCDNCENKVPFDKISIIQSVLGSLVGSLDLDDQFRLEPSVLSRLADFVPYSSHIFVDLRLRLTLRLGFIGIKLNGICLN